jgi:hypothetical protein
MLCAALRSADEMNQEPEQEHPDFPRDVYGRKALEERQDLRRAGMINQPFRGGGLKAFCQRMRDEAKAEKEAQR